MRNIFFISDTHFGHANICKFKRHDGSPLRPWDDVSEMDEEMVRRWNSKVSNNDVIYHLGDVVMNRRCLSILHELNGEKRLILGNHDIFDHHDYLKYFKRLYGSHKIDNLWLTHIPIHTDSIPHWALCNLHGHIHAQDVPDGRYFNVSVEMIDYQPISLDELKKSIHEKQIKYPVDISNRYAKINSIS
jgi:calcineurin-like phosphoesterase family protein